MCSVKHVKYIIMYITKNKMAGIKMYNYEILHILNHAVVFFVIYISLICD